MRILQWAGVVMLAAGMSACSNPNCPSPAQNTNPVPMSGAAKWALDHINEVCIAQYPMNTRQPGHLIPVGDVVPFGWMVVAISYCNPAE